jgi:hypothetical protein
VVENGFDGGNPWTVILGEIRVIRKRPARINRIRVAAGIEPRVLRPGENPAAFPLQAS